jgi:fatty-acyl-CoA synthase
MNQSHWPPGAPRHIEIPQTSLYYNLLVSATRYPDRPALYYYGRAISYARLLKEVDALAGWLARRCQVRPGDRVALYMQNSPQFIIAYYAILRADAVVVPINTMNRLEEVRHIVVDSGSRTAIFGQELAPGIVPLIGTAIEHGIIAAYSEYIDSHTDLPLPDVVAAAPASRIAGTVAWRDAVEAAQEPGPHHAGPSSLSVMPYTSGTTGVPKGCLHTHSSVMHTAVSGAEWCRSSKDGTVLAALPMFHVTGMQNGMNTPIYVGSTVAVMTRWDKACAALLIERYRVMAWTAIPTMLIDFLNQDLSGRDLSSLHLLTGGGAAMPAAVCQKIRDRLGVEYIEGYGMSETMAPTHINPRHRPKPNCLGLPIFSTTALVVDPETLRSLPAGQVGEIIVSGPQVLLGYRDDPSKDAEAFVEIDGRRFLRTGDLGYIDDEGYFFMVDRLKRMINNCGFKVWPAEVEAHLYSHPGVLQACVIACRDPHRGEGVKALIVPRPNQALSAADLITWSREKMATYKAPQFVEFVDVLPTLATGKVDWRSLQEREYARSA